MQSHRRIFFFGLKKPFWHYSYSLKKEEVPTPHYYSLLGSLRVLNEVGMEVQIVESEKEKIPFLKIIRNV
jgi:hypothetical protein